MGEYLNLPYELLDVLQELADAQHGNELEVFLQDTLVQEL